MAAIWREGNPLILTFLHSSSSRPDRGTAIACNVFVEQIRSPRETVSHAGAGLFRLNFVAEVGVDANERR